MGYYVRGEGEFFLRNNRLDRAYEEMCALNDDDSLKRGGRYNIEDAGKPEGLRYNPNRWFSWMDYNYPETCSDVFAIMRMLGFTILEKENENGCIKVRVSYDDKTGQEELFTEVLARHCTHGELYWTGEDGEQWREVFSEGKRIVEHARIVYGE